MTTIAAGTRTYEYDHTIGMDDFAGRAFRNLSDLALGPEEVLYVLQRGEPLHHNVSVKICTVGEEWIGDFGRYGTAPGQMVWPAGIATDSRQRLFVSDEWNQRISVFDTEGSLLGEWGEAGSGPGQLKRPCGVAVDTEGNLLVVDSGNHRIQRFTPEGQLLDGFGEHGQSPGQFNLPWGVAVNDAGDIFVTDWRNDRIQKFTGSGDFVLEWGEAGSGPGQFNRPAGIAVDRDGDVYVADWHNDRVQVFDAQGEYITHFIGDATMSTWGAQLMLANPVMEGHRQTAKYPEREGRLYRPRSVKVDGENRIFIVDSNKGRLQVYRKL